MKVLFSMLTSVVFFHHIKEDCKAEQQGQQQRDAGNGTITDNFRIIEVLEAK